MVDNEDWSVPVQGMLGDYDDQARKNVGDQDQNRMRKEKPPCDEKATVVIKRPYQNWVFFFNF